MKRIVALLAVVACMASGQAFAAVIFEENFAGRPNGQQVLGTAPNVDNTGGAVFSKHANLGASSVTQINEWAPGVKGLYFQPQGANAGAGDQNVFLPYAHEFDSRPVRLTVVARQAQPRWNNFSIGFTDPSGGFQSWFLLQTNSSGVSQVQHFHDAIRTSPFPANANDFRELVVEYDPTKVHTAGVNPFSLYVDSTNVPLVGGNIPPLLLPAWPGQDIGGVGIGFFNASGSIDRAALIESIKFEIIPEPSMVVLGSLGLAGLIGQIRRKRRERTASVVSAARATPGATGKS